MLVAFIVVAIAVSVVLSTTSNQSPSDDSNPTLKERTHGSVLTTMASPLLGDSSAPVTIIEFGDYQCHFCKKWFDETKPTIMDQYIDTGKANFIFVDMAFLGSDSPLAAQATYCADDQGMYWDYHEILYNFQESKVDGGWANFERLQAFASSLGLDLDEFTECLNSGKYVQRVQFNTAEARSHGITATPGFIIVGQDNEITIRGAQPLSTFIQTLDSLI